MKIRSASALLLAFTVLTSANVFAGGETGYFQPGEGKQFVVTGGLGYGLSNNPCKNCSSGDAIGGATFALSLGYKFSDRFKLEVGPTFWIEAKDLFNKSVSDNERPNNKRTLVTLSGSYQPVKRSPLLIKLGAGAGTLNYTPEKKTVRSDEQKYDETEIFKGVAGTFGLSYEMNLCPFMKIYPSLNVWYIHFDTPGIRYDSYIDYRRDSFTTDVRLNVHFSF